MSIDKLHTAIKQLSTIDIAELQKCITSKETHNSLIELFDNFLTGHKAVSTPLNNNLYKMFSKAFLDKLPELLNVGFLLFSRETMWSGTTDLKAALINALYGETNNTLSDFLNSIYFHKINDLFSNLNDYIQPDILDYIFEAFQNTNENIQKLQTICEIARIHYPQTVINEKITAVSKILQLLSIDNNASIREKENDKLRKKYALFEAQCEHYVKLFINSRNVVARYVEQFPIAQRNYHKHIVNDALASLNLEHFPHQQDISLEQFKLLLAQAETQNSNIKICLDNLENPEITSLFDAMLQQPAKTAELLELITMVVDTQQQHVLLPLMKTLVNLVDTETTDELLPPLFELRKQIIENANDLLSAQGIEQFLEKYNLSERINLDALEAHDTIKQIKQADDEAKKLAQQNNVSNLEQSLPLFRYLVHHNLSNELFLPKTNLFAREQGNQHLYDYIEKYQHNPEKLDNLVTFLQVVYDKEQYSQHALRPLLNGLNYAITRTLDADIAQHGEQLDTENDDKKDLLTAKINTEKYMREFLFEQQVNVACAIKDNETNIPEFIDNFNRRWNHCKIQTKNHAVTAHRNKLIRAIDTMLSQACGAVLSVIDKAKALLKTPDTIVAMAIKPDDNYKLDTLPHFFNTNTFNKYLKVDEIVKHAVSKTPRAA